MVQDRRTTWRGTWRLGNLTTPNSVQKLQTALHAKAKAEAGYRFYTLYDKIYREDILAYAYAQCRSNDGRAGGGWRGLHGGRSVRGAAVARRTGAGAQGGELPTGTDQTSVYTEGQWRRSRPLGISTLRDRVVHDSSDAGARTDLRSRPAVRAVRLPAGPKCPTGGGGGGTNGCTVAVTEVVDADLADYFGVDSARRTDAVARAAHRRSARAASDQDVAGMRRWKKPTTRGRKTRTTRRPRTTDAAPARLIASHRCWPICTCGGLCWGGRSSGIERRFGSPHRELCRRLRDLCRIGARRKRPWQRCAKIMES